jgi:cell fate regulator YaaT (PSP1 superfamily)
LAVFGKPRYLGLVDIGEPLPEMGSWIVIKTLRGLEMGVLGGTLSQEQVAKYRTACLDEPGDEHTRGPEPLLQEVEFVEPADGVRLEECRKCRSDEDGALIRSRQILGSHQLQMKLVDVEYTLDRKKLFFYFTSEQRVDFRAYVRDLAKEFRVRIEMRQIGVRDEAKTVRGIAPCGRPCCCSHWLHRFTPINIRMVKEQNLVLNPTKISGICGRLMCCMAYEHSTYNNLWRSLPSPGSKLKTPQGNYALEGIDLRTETVKIRSPEGREISVPIAEFPDFRETVLAGNAWKEEPAPEPARRVPFSPVGRSGSPGSVKESLARVLRRPKPEKVTIEEHLAGREAEKRLTHEKNEKNERNEKTGGEDAALLKKRGKKRKPWDEGEERPAAAFGQTHRVHAERNREQGREQPREHGKEHPRSAAPRESSRLAESRSRLDRPSRPESARPGGPREAPRIPRDNRDRRGRRPNPGEGGPQAGKEGL